ncbi:MAG: type II toxin-antitoxin system HigA family antitoxin [Candidatus Sumerlaeia bacterium]
MKVWPIRSEADYDRAVEVVNALAVQPEGSLSEKDQDRLEVFTRLIEAWDKEHYSEFLEGSSPLEVLQSLLDEHEMSNSDLGRLLGNRQTGHAIMKGHRSLSKAHIRKLSEYFNLSPEVFIE